MIKNPLIIRFSDGKYFEASYRDGYNEMSAYQDMLSGKPVWYFREIVWVKVRVLWLFKRMKWVCTGMTWETKDASEFCVIEKW